MPTSTNISLKGLSALLHSAGTVQAGTEQALFNSFINLLLSWPGEMGSSISFRDHVYQPPHLFRGSTIPLQIHKRDQSKDSKDQHLYILGVTCRVVYRFIGLFIPKLTTLREAPGVITAVLQLMGDKQSSSQKLLQDSVRHLQPTKWREYEGDRAFPSSSPLTQEKHSAVTCCQLSSHSAC